MTTRKKSTKTQRNTSWALTEKHLAELLKRGDFVEVKSE
jgi:hypothetical protein